MFAIEKNEDRSQKRKKRVGSLQQHSVRSPRGYTQLAFLLASSLKKAAVSSSICAVQLYCCGWKTSATLYGARLLQYGENMCQRLRLEACSNTLRCAVTTARRKHVTKAEAGSLQQHSVRSPRGYTHLAFLLASSLKRAAVSSSICAVQLYC